MEVPVPYNVPRVVERQVDCPVTVTVTEQVPVPVTVQKTVTRPVPQPVPRVSAPPPIASLLPAHPLPSAGAQARAVTRFGFSFLIFSPNPSPRLSSFVCTQTVERYIDKLVPTPVEVRVPQPVQVPCPVEVIRYRDIPVPQEHIVEKVVTVTVERRVPVTQVLPCFPFLLGCCSSLLWTFRHGSLCSVVVSHRSAR